MTPISFPDDDIYEDGVVVSIQPDEYDEFSVQVQIQSLSITEMITYLKVPQSNVNLNSNKLFRHEQLHTDIHQLFVLIQILPTVDIYYDNHKYVSKFPQYHLFCSKFQPSTLDSLVTGRFPSFGDV